MNRCLQGHGAQRGSALIIALALLTVFVALGSVFVSYVGMRVEDNKIELRRAYAASAAEAGVNATIGDIATILERGGLIPVSMDYDFPVYGMVKTNVNPEVNDGLELTALELRRAWADVSIEDESGKININHAPASVLRHLLGGDGDTARSLAETAREKPFISLDELKTRGGLTDAQFDKLKDNVTVYTVVDHQDPTGYINLRAASPAVVGALFDIYDEGVMHTVAQGNPTSLEQLCAFAGDPDEGPKNPATFNIPMDPDSPSALPPALALTSRCFKLVSEGNFAYEQEGPTADEDPYYNKSIARVEAVVLFNLDGSYEILKWSTQRNHLS